MFKQYILHLVQHAEEDKNVIEVHKKVWSGFILQVVKLLLFILIIWLFLCLSAFHVISNSSGRRRKWLSINVCERRELLRLTFGPNCRIQGKWKLPEERVTPDKNCNRFHGLKLIWRYIILLPLYQSCDFKLTTSHSIYQDVVHVIILPRYAII